MKTQDIRLQIEQFRGIFFFCKVGQYIINFKSKTYPLIKQVKFFKERISKKKSSQNAVKDTAA